MKIRRVTVEIEVPYQYDSNWVLSRVRIGLSDMVIPIPHQEQVIKDEVSSNKKIGREAI